MLKPFTIAPLAAAVLSICLLSPAVRAEPVELKHKWTKGQVLTYRQTQDTSSEMVDGPMGDMKSTNKLTATLRFEVQEVAADGAATMKMSYLAYRLEQSNPMQGQQVLDASKPQDIAGDPATKKIVGSLLTTTVTLVIQPDGKIRSLDGMNKVVDDAFAAEAEKPAKMAMEGVKGQFGDVSLRQTLEGAFRVLPDKKVDSGATWQIEHRQVTPLVGTLVKKATYTLKDSSANPAMVDYTMTVIHEPAKADPEIPMIMKFELKDASASGSIEFDRAAGVLKKSRGASLVAMTLSMSPAGADEPMKMGQKSVNNSTFELLEGAAAEAPTAPAPPAAPKAAQ